MPCIISGSQIYTSEEQRQTNYRICSDEIPKFPFEYYGKCRFITVRKIPPLTFTPKQMDPITV